MKLGMEVADNLDVNPYVNMGHVLCQSFFFIAHCCLAAEIDIAVVATRADCNISEIYHHSTSTITLVLSCQDFIPQYLFLGGQSRVQKLVIYSLVRLCSNIA